MRASPKIVALTASIAVVALCAMIAGVRSRAINHARAERLSIDAFSEASPQFSPRNLRRLAGKRLSTFGTIKKSVYVADDCYAVGDNPSGWYKGMVKLKLASGQVIPNDGTSAQITGTLIAKDTGDQISYELVSATVESLPAPIRASGESRIAYSILLALSGAAGIACYRFRKSELKVHRLAAGHCVNCGYDMRACPDRCSECGVAKPH